MRASERERDRLEESERGEARWLWSSGVLPEVLTSTTYNRHTQATVAPEPEIEPFNQMHFFSIFI